MKTKTLFVHKDSTTFLLHTVVQQECESHEAHGWGVRLIRPVQDGVFVVFEMVPPASVYQMGGVSGVTYTGTAIATS